MERIVNYDYSTAIEYALLCIPKKIREMLKVDFLTGTDPIYAGLHNHLYSIAGIACRNIAHCVDPSIQSLPKYLRKTTIVLPNLVAPGIIVHELGHVLHEEIGRQIEAIEIRPITFYAYSHPWEAFAEAFTAYCGMFVPEIEIQLYKQNKLLVEFFDGLSKN